jgi:hypothetical protein
MSIDLNDRLHALGTHLDDERATWSASVGRARSSRWLAAAAAVTIAVGGVVVAASLSRHDAGEVAAGAPPVTTATSEVLATSSTPLGDVAISFRSDDEAWCFTRGDLGGCVPSTVFGAGDAWVVEFHNEPAGTSRVLFNDGEGRGIGSDPVDARPGIAATAYGYVPPGLDVSVTVAGATAVPDENGVWSIEIPDGTASFTLTTPSGSQEITLG